MRIKRKSNIKRKKYIIGIVALALVSIVGVSTFAYIITGNKKIEAAKEDNEKENNEKESQNKINTNNAGYAVNTKAFYQSAYISALKPIAHRKMEITRGKDEIYEFHPIDTDKFKILQLTDTHVSGIYTNYHQDSNALSAIYTMINATKPDFIIITGDMIFGTATTIEENDLAALTAVINLMDRIGIPWTWAFGNHDHYAMDKYTNDKIKELLNKSESLLIYDDMENVKGYSNGMFRIFNSNGTQNSIIFTMDSNGEMPTGDNTYVDYDYIDDTQVAWYEKMVNAEKKILGKLPNSYIFIHIPLQEYNTAWNDYKAGKKEVIYHWGDKRENVSSSSIHSRIFEKAVELGSTKAIFCGHDHTNDYSLTYQGIQLVYSKSIDYCAYPGIEEQTQQRGATLITLEESGKAMIKPIKLVDVNPD